MLAREVEATKLELEEKAVALGHNMGAWQKVGGCDYISVCSDCGREIMVCESIGVLLEIAAAPCVPGEEEKDDEAEDGDIDEEDGDIDEEDRDEDDEDDEEVEGERTYEVYLKRLVTKRHWESAFVLVDATNGDEAEEKALELYNSGGLEVEWDEYDSEEVDEDVWVDCSTELD